MKAWTLSLELLKNVRMMHLTYGGPAERIIDVAFYAFLPPRLGTWGVLQKLSRRA